VQVVTATMPDIEPLQLMSSCEKMPLAYLI